MSGERVAALFLNNRSQAVRIPREFELPGREVTISRLPDGSLVLRPRLDILAVLAELAPLSDEDGLEPVADPPPDMIDL